ncbi:hypothetical protein TRFO_26016 [Tritrichomonas foetus]|uniref:Importin N-terminal domain-containing protein n=1 Tax=Tritrichomonas foetus TaxID=1144522 RepID=A0A1J4K8Q2_9EUKA|nr:hypothetical protein TRFO_26016 [Tritrichomonas foetus]|eukprot:OHT06092.1 hypothetical protein TRFO_26016 [Tritrichomonas foetus]
MNVEQFQLLLLGLSQPSDENNQCSNILMQMCEQNVYEFLRLNLLVLSQEINPRIGHYAITMIYIQVKNGNIFQSLENATSFWTQFVQIVPVVFASPVLPDNSKLLVSHTISYFAIHFFNSNHNTQIQFYILKLFQENPNFEQYIISCIEDIIISTEEFGGFPFEAVSQILIADHQFEASFIPKMKLFFAVAMRFPENPQLIEFFPHLLEKTPPNLMKEMISTMSSFAEISANFFEPHLAVISQMLCQIACNAQCDFRNEAIFCIDSFIKGAPNMCCSKTDFFLPVIQALITIMSEINEEVSLEDDLNDTTPCIIARSTIGSLYDNCINNEKMFFPVKALFEEVRPKLDLLKWPVIHAFIATFVEMGHNVSYVIYNNFEMHNEEDMDKFINDFIQFLNPSVVPHLKIAVFELIESLSCRMLFQPRTSNIIIPIVMNTIVSENNPYVQKEAVLALTCFLDNLVRCNLVVQFRNVIEILAQMLPLSPPYLKPLLVRCFRTFMKSDRYYSSEFHHQYINILWQLYTNTTENDLKIQIISAFTQSFKFTNDSIHLFKIEEVIQKGLTFLNDAIILSEENDEELQQSMINLIILLDERCFPLIQQYNVIMKALEEASQDIQIQSYGQFDVIEMPSVLKKIPSIKAGTKLYILISDERNVHFALTLINRLIWAKIYTFVNMNEIIPKLIDIVQKWINNTYHIEKIAVAAWILLSSLLVFTKGSPIFASIVNTFMQDFFNSIGVGDISYNEHILRIFEKHLADEVLVIPQFVNELLVKLTGYADTVIDNLLKLTTDLIKFEIIDDVSNDEALGRDVNYATITLELVGQTINKLMAQYPDITIPFLQKGYLQKLCELMNNVVAMTYAMIVLTKYCICSHDIPFTTKLVKLLTEIGFKCSHQISSQAFILAAKIFRECDIPNECVLEIYAMYLTAIPEIQENVDSNTGYSDLALGSMAVLIKKYRNIINYDEAAYFWLTAFPIWEENALSDYSYSYLADLLEAQHPSIFSYDNFERIISNLIITIDSQMVGEETNNRLRAIIKAMAANPENDEMMQHMITEELRREAYYSIVHDE